jgi:hypothetical protein
VRRWVPLAPVALVLALMIGGLPGAGVGASAGASAGATPATPGGQTTPVQTGFGGAQDFCAQQPLRGGIRYGAQGGRASMQVDVRGLPPRKVLAIDWANNTVRGYTVGVVDTDRQGATIPGSVRLFRPGETRGYKVVLTTSASVPTTLGTLWPCGPPGMRPPSVVDDPRITVTPDTGLHDGQGVTVSVSGFGKDQKVFLSECDHAEDATVLGCAPQLAVEPFLLTGARRSGSAMFVVHQTAAGSTSSAPPRQTCRQLCVIVATQGAYGAWIVARIAFGSSRPVGAGGS